MFPIPEQVNDNIFSNREFKFRSNINMTCMVMDITKQKSKVGQSHEILTAPISWSRKTIVTIA